MKFRISGPYGELSEVRNFAPHNGIDLAMPNGTEIHSYTGGIVDKVFDGSGSIGEGLSIKLDSGARLIYGHMDQVNVEVGEQVHYGELLGISGNTGNSTGPHLHFGMQLPNGSYVDPSPVVEKVDAMAGSVETGNWLIDKWNAAGEWVVGKEVDLILKPLQQALHDGLLATWDWFVASLPDIMGYGTVMAGVCIILSAMAGKGIVKPAGWFGGALIIAVSILTYV
jgi:murein DD-endopeptidase MepM/ murein hydrolase activator NlpD